MDQGHFPHLSKLQKLRLTINQDPKWLNKEPIKKPLIEAIWQAQFEHQEDLAVGGGLLLGIMDQDRMHTADVPKVETLGWSALETLETHLRLRNFADDWDAPGMDAYDDL